MSEVKNKFEEEVNIKNISKLFKSGCKFPDEHRVGIEFERLPISSINYKMIDYSKENGIYDLLRSFAKLDGWEYITDDYNIVGLKKGNDYISLEPGCQLELSFAPAKTISDVKSKIDNFNKKIGPILKKYDINLLEYGISPVSTYKHINLIPKKRYYIMTDYLWGILSDVMMRETAGIQACLDFSSEEDAVKKFRMANIISPLVSAMFANSPIRGGVDTGYKTFRGLTWLNTDSDRCPYISKKLFEDRSNYGFKDYIQDVLETPMIYIMRNEKPVEILGKVTFEQFMKRGFEGYTATLEDFKLHANLYFPEVRLRDFIEIRNHDCVNHGMQYSILGLYKGILYDNQSMADAEELMSEFSYNNLCEFRYNVPRTALSSKIGKKQSKDVAFELLKIAHRSLKKTQEEHFLDPIMELVPFGLTPADIILSNWNGHWNKDVSKLIKYLNT